MQFKQWMETFVPHIDKGQELLDKLKSSGLNFVSFPNPWKKSSGIAESILVLYSYRYIVSVNVNGTNIPFYQSTGEGGKENVPAGRWYPFFGIGPDGWINKGTEEQINNFYGSSALKGVASQLDNATGDIREAGYSNHIISVKENGPLITLINGNLNPTQHKNGSQKLQDNINSILQKIGEKPQSTKPNATKRLATWQ